MRLDGEDIIVGDSVYDLGFGSGKVIEVGDKIRVRFNSLKQTFSYDGRGMRRAVKMRQLYFHNPIIAVPAKDDKDFSIICDNAKALTSILRSA